MRWTYDDGGRAAAGYQGIARDCGTRAVAIATGRDYQEVYDRFNELAKRERRGKRKGGQGISSARDGIFVQTMHRYMQEIGWEWTPTMHIGSGCTVHMREDELPSGTLVLRVSRHYCAVVDGVIRDTYDPSRDGTRCVYGYWKAGEA